MKLYLIIPCYNEENVLDETYKRLNEKITKLVKSKIIDSNSKVIFIDDGSKDNTWDLIEKYSKNKFFSGIKLSRNFGHQNAVLSGLLTFKDDADIFITMDADLQDDIEKIDEFIDKYKLGNDIVYGVRNNRKKDSFFKRNSAKLTYKIMKFMGIEIVSNHADYRLMSKKVIDKLQNFSETNLFLRGIIPLIGYKSDIVYYERDKRFAGESKYSLSKMINFGIDGITSFTIKPIRFIFFIGLIIFLFSLIMLIYTLVQHFLGNTVTGWSSIIFSIWTLGGLQLLSIGIIGEYIGKVYMETKNRPRYIIEKNLEEK